MTDNNTVQRVQHYIVHFYSGTFGSLYIVELFRDAPLRVGSEAGSSQKRVNFPRHNFT